VRGLCRQPAVYFIISLFIWSGAQAAGSKGGRAGTARVYGRVIDAQTRHPADYASVSILLVAKDSLISGMLTESNGDFSFDNIPKGTFRLKVTYMGYKDYVKTITVAAGAEQDLGNIAIETNAKKLNEVVVTGERAASTLAVDKKVFNVDKDLSSRGGSAMDVMQNLPGVAVDADGNVTLRNNSPLIYVDGKPTTLTLDQIPSDQIDRVEVITNPSAKYEAAAAGGIINVVLKHNTKPGYNGLISMLVGTNDQYNGTANINFHKKKIGASLSANVSGATSPTVSYDNRTNLNDPSSTFDQTLLKVNKRRYENIRAGLDFYISNRNTLSISEHVVFGWFSNTINANQTSLDSANTEVSAGKNYNYEGVTRRNYTTMIDFKHTYPRKGKEYNITLQYDRQTSVTTFIDTTDTYSPAGNLLPGSAGIFKQDIPSGIESHMVTAQWDFTHPITDSLKLEYGVRGYYKRTNSFANTYSYSDSTGVYTFDAPLSTDFLTNETIDAAYFSVSQQKKRFSYQIGVRYEEDYFLGQLLNTPRETFSYRYPSSPSRFYESFFPSFFLAQSINDHHLFQLNATRKTNRPSPGQINPNLEVVDQQDYTKGNAALQPEFINQGEFNYSLTYSAVDWLSSAYARYTEHPIVGITTDSSQILLATYTNGKGKFNYGWENTVKVFPVKNLSVSVDVNVFYTIIQAYLPEGNENALLTNAGFSYTAKAIINYKFPMGFAAQVNGSYEAPKPVPEGMTLPVYYFDVAASKELGQFTINFAVSDVLNSHVNGYNYDVPDEYTQYLSKRRQPRYAKLGLTYKFGKEDKSGRSRRKKDKDVPKDEDQD
jgi:hypothetical protein